MRRFLLFFTVALLLFIMPAVLFSTKASAATSGYYTYEVSNGEVTITDCLTSTTGIIIIPASLGGYPVTGIGEDAFYNCTNLTNVIIPEGVTSIGPCAFEGCSSLNSITIPNSIVEIGEKAFYDCTNLTSVQVSNIGAWCNISFADIYANPVSYAGKLYLNKVLVTALQIDSKVTCIGNFAFYGCTALTSVSFSDSVTNIGNYAFYGCTGMTEIILPDNVTDIGERAFSNCTGFTSINIPEKCTSIGRYAFLDCTSLTGIWVDKNNTAYSNDDDGVLFNKEKTELIVAPPCLDTNGYLSQYFIPNSVENICAYAFKGSKKLRYITIRANDIGYYAFADCNNLESVTIYGSVTEIDNSVFKNCANLKNISIPASVKQISFSGCPRISYNSYGNALYLGNSSNPYVLLVSSHSQDSYSCEIHPKTIAINPDAFKNSTGLTGVLIGENVSTIGASAFYGCTNLASVAIFDGVTSIGDYAFYGCSSLKNITISNSITRVGNAAFNGCENLQYNIFDNAKYLGSGGNPYMILVGPTTKDIATCTIHTDATVMSDYAFLNCRQLTSVTIPGNITTVSSFAFAHCNKLANVVLEDGVAAIGDYAFYGQGLVSVVFPKSLAFIDNCGFCAQKGLSTVIYKGTLLENSNILIKSGNDYLTSATWHYECSDTTFAEQQCLYCPECDNYYLPDGSYAKATVTFKDWDGTVLASNTYCYCEEVVAPNDPERVADNTYTYMFAGWDQPVVNCAGNATYTATYTPDYIDYTVVFKDWDGTVLSTEVYHWGDTIVEPDTPTKTADNTYTYAFTGWNKAVVDCAGNATYTATYAASYIDYTIVFKNWNGDILSSNTYHYGDKVTVPADPVRAADNTYAYAFAGWNNTVVDCAGDAIYTATYTPAYINYTVVFIDWNGTEISAQNYHYGDKVTVPADPARDADNTYTYAFVGWDKEIVNCVGNAVYIASYTSTYIDYTVVFKDWDDTVLSSKTYHWGDKVTMPINPVKEADNTYTYAFMGWDKDVVNCAGNATYTATYTSTYIDYTVVFNDWNGSVISTTTYHYGDEVTVPADPTRVADNMYTYTFAGWDKEVVNCAGDATYVAAYTPAYIDYTVVFKDWDGTVLSIKGYHWGDEVTIHTSPTKSADNTYTYAFTGWDKAVVNCAGNAIYTATYSATYIDYVVTFRNWNGEVLSNQIYHYGDKVKAPSNPSKTSDNTYNYVFAGWDKTVVSCVGNETYTATFTPAYINYTVVFKDWDGTILSADTYHWGEQVVAPADPIKAADNSYTYNFAGWGGEVIDCAGNATYTATYTSAYIDYTVVFKDWNGTVLSAQTYHYGEQIAVPSNPTKASDNTYTYTFKGWDKAVTDCTGDATYTAVYTPMYVDYTIVFKDWDGTVLSTKNYHYGDKVIAPANPCKVADNTYTYLFTGWDKDVTDCAGDVTYTATYTSAYIDYTIVFKNWDGAVLSTETYHYGDVVMVPTDPTRAADNTYAYAFTGWDKIVVNCTGNVIYTATYQPVYIDYTVVFKNWDGSVISTNTYHYGDNITVPINPVRPADDTYVYTFTGWDKTVVACGGDSVYTAVYGKQTRVPSAITSSAYAIGDATISKISMGTTVSILMGKLNEGRYVKVFNGNQEAGSSALVGTGMVAKIMDGNAVKASYTIVVTGDTNGDGKITVTDMLAVKAHVLKKSTLSGAAAQAADTSGDSAISITDFIQMKAQILGKSNVEPRAVDASVQQLSVISVKPETSAVTAMETTVANTANRTAFTLSYTQVIAVIPDKKAIVTV